MHENGGWEGAYHRYCFDGMNWQEGANLRNKFHRQLIEAGDVGERLKVSSEILCWGRMKPMDGALHDSLNRSLDLLSNGTGESLKQICSRRIATVSKIYEMWDPTKWVIYDSYCVRGLQWLVSPYLAAHSSPATEALLRFPWPAGRKGQPMQGFVRLGTEKQARLGFLYASWLCRAIAEQLNRSGRTDHFWEAFHVEMAAFQIGHEV